jgi:hypothetical protein
MGWSEGRAAATVSRYGPPAFGGCMTMISAFQFDNNGQNIQFTGQKFMLFPEWNTFAATPFPGGRGVTRPQVELVSLAACRHHPCSETGKTGEGCELP